MNKYQPLGTRILVKEDAVAERTAGGIIIPQTAQQRKNTGVVISVGEKCEQLAAGDKIMYPQGQGSEIIIDKETFWLMFEDVVDMKL